MAWKLLRIMRIGNAVDVKAVGWRLHVARKVIQFITSATGCLIPDIRADQPQTVNVCTTSDAVNDVGGVTFCRQFASTTSCSSIASV
jgi:hypothetical protein